MNAEFVWKFHALYTYSLKTSLSVKFKHHFRKSEFGHMACEKMSCGLGGHSHLKHLC